MISPKGLGAKRISARTVTGRAAFAHDARRWDKLEGMMLTVSRHLIAEYYGCNREILDDEERVRAAILVAADVVGATVLGHMGHRFAPQGVSGTVVIAESHLSIHTWPEKGYAAADVFTCGGLDPRPAFEILGDAFGATEGRLQEILRGLPEEIDAGGEILPEDVQVITRMSAPRPLRRASDPSAGRGSRGEKTT